MTPAAIHTSSPMFTLLPSPPVPSSTLTNWFYVWAKWWGGDGGGGEEGWGRVGCPGGAATASAAPRLEYPRRKRGSCSAATGSDQWGATDTKIAKPMAAPLVSI